MPRSAARRTASVTRSSASMPSATYSAVAGMPARRHSTTGLRPGHGLRRRPSSLRRGAALAASRLRRDLGPLVRGVVRALDRLRGRALALQPLGLLPAGADDRALLRARLAHRALALGIASHELSRPSKSTADRRGCPRRRCPRRSRRSRTASARAKSRSARAPGARRAVGPPARSSACRMPMSADDGRSTSATTGRAPSTSAIRARTSAAADAAVSSSPASSAVLPWRTVLCSAASGLRACPGRRPSRRRTPGTCRRPARSTPTRSRDAAQERLDAPVGRHRLLQRGLGVLDASTGSAAPTR